MNGCVANGIVSHSRPSICSDLSFKPINTGKGILPASLAGDEPMPFVDITDVGTTLRRKLTPHRRLKVWERTGGVCVLCDLKIDGARERWIAEHLRALELGGADHFDNLGPAHEACAVQKTKEDHRRTARAKRQKIRHIGADAPKRPLPFWRASRWKRTLSGKIVPRE
jgi:hypothetical protein